MTHTVIIATDLLVRIARNWKHIIHTGAKSYHNNSPSKFKQLFSKVKMGMVYRYFVMTRSLDRKELHFHVRFLIS